MEHLHLERHACELARTYVGLGDCSESTRPWDGADVTRPTGVSRCQRCRLRADEPLNLLSEVWPGVTRLSDDEAWDVDTIASVSLTSFGGSGGVAWSGDWWNRIYVTGDSDWAKVLGERMALGCLRLCPT